VEEQTSRLSIARQEVARVLEDSAVAEPPAGQDGRPAGKPRPASPASVLPRSYQDLLGVAADAAASSPPSPA
jgi:hypothetical protein